MERILLVGEDLVLLASRMALLRKPTSKITCCIPHEFWQQLEGEHYDLVLLCHSLNPGVARWIALEARRRWSDARLLLITTETCHPSSIECDADAVVTSMQPEQLVRTANALLFRKPPQSERHWDQRSLRTAS